ncbi:MAG: nicotinate (nicotinamide) nucleotide adenylyltransferase [Eubacterium sp.]
MNIGIYGGAFNPVHNGHINLAEKAIELLSLEKLLFIPTAIPPHKSGADFASQQDRYNMLTLAADGIDNSEISCIEFERQGKSYTFDTLMELKKIYPDDKLFLIIGADQFLTFHLWYRSRDILSMVTLCAAARENDSERALMLEYAKKLDGLGENNFYLLDFPALKVSSSDIRKMVRNNEDITEFVPDKVCKYIFEKGLYSV